MKKPENREMIGRPCFARYNMWHKKGGTNSIHPYCYIFDLYFFDINEAHDLKDFFDYISEQTLHLNWWFGLTCVRKREDDFEDADDAFDKETKQLLSEVEYKIDLLRRKGISEVVLQKLVMPKPKLSKLVITKDLRIFLPDYDNMEITMEPLVKAVFLLFLKHPEGIMFKELPEYRHELAEIYGRIKGARVSRNLFGIRSYDKSIINATDPLNNSINEKCARIRAAFLLKFQESLAENYFITGKRGEPKMIKLPRNMVEWEE